MTTPTTLRTPPPPLTRLRYNNLCYWALFMVYIGIADDMSFWYVGPTGFEHHPLTDTQDGLDPEPLGEPVEYLHARP